MPEFINSEEFLYTNLLKTGQITQYNSELDDGYYERGLSKIYEILTIGQYSGNAEIDLIHLVSDTGAFTVADQTYTDVGKCGVFLAAGGDEIRISGSLLNNGVFTTASATADTVVVTAGFVDEADAPMTTFMKREAHSNNCVVDLRSDPRFGRRMWSRYVAGKMGAASNGKLPWTTHANGYGIYPYVLAANAAVLGGYGDWRIPNDIELSNLRDMEAPTAAPDAIAFPGWPRDDVWGSTSLSNSPDVNATKQNFLYGALEYGTKTSTAYAALIRGG